MVLYEQRLSEDLQQIRYKVQDIADRVCAALENAVAAIAADDRDALHQVVMNDYGINRDIRCIDKRCHEFVARHLPAAGHLRFISAVLRITIALERAGVVHDIGKVSIPDGVLKKPGPLSSDERSEMKRHPLIGEQICKPLRSFRLVLPIIRHHHERMDGSGYPVQLDGDAIPLSARILSVVDVFDALPTDRPYQSAFTQDEALEEMAREVDKGWWDPRVFEAFRELIVEEGWKISD